MDWFATGVRRQLLKRVVQHYRLSGGTPWEGLDEADVVDCAKAVLDGMGYVTWREFRYPGTEAKVDITTESLDAEDPEQWVEVKRIYDRDNRLAHTRFDVTDRELLKDFERLLSLPHNAEGTVIWAIYSKSPSLAQAGGQTPASYTIAQAIDRVHQTFGLRPVDGSLCDCSTHCSVEEAYRYLHLIVWRFPSRSRQSAAPSAGVP